MITDAELARRLREHAYLEGDFVLRSGKRSRYYLDKYRFETRPDLLGALGERLGARVREVASGAVREIPFHVAGTRGSIAPPRFDVAVAPDDVRARMIRFAALPLAGAALRGRSPLACCDWT